MSGQTGRTIFTVAGFAIGAYFGNAALGTAIGGALGTALFPIALPGLSDEGPKLGDLKVQSSTYGTMIPLLYGSVRIAGKLIWSQAIKETPVASSEDVGQGKGGPNTTQDSTQTTYTYSVNIAIDLGEGGITGEIIGVRKIWGNNELIYDTTGTGSFETFVHSRSNADSIRIHLGSQTQDVDPLIEAVQGVGATPAYRGVAYVVFENLQLAKFSNRIPNFEFEVVTAGAVTSTFDALDTAYQLGGAVSVSNALFDGSITPDGLLLGYLGNNPANTQSVMALLDPFTLEVLRTWQPFPYTAHYSGMTGSTGGLGEAPQMNGRGDILFQTQNAFGQSETWSWLATESGPVKVRLQLCSRICRDEHGNFYVAGQYTLFGLTQIAVMKVAPSTSFDDYIFIGESTVTWAYGRDLFYSTDGSLWLLIETVAGPNIIKQMDTGGGVMRTYTPLYSGIRSIAIAGDGSLWYYRANPIALVRVALDFLSETVVYSSAGGSPTITNMVRINRDWNNGDILCATGNAGDALGRFTQEGAARTLYAAGAVAPLRIITAYDYPNLVYGSTSWGNGNGHAIGGERRDIVAPSTVPLSDVITNLVSRVGVAAGDLTFTGISDGVQGYVVSTRGPVRSMLDPLMMGYLLDAVESGSKLKFFKRGGAAIVAIPEADMGAHSDGTDLIDPLTTQRLQEPELPHELAVSYFDVDANYQVATQYARRLSGASENDSSINLALVLDGTKTRRLCEALLYEAWVARMKFSVPVSQKYAKYEPGDVVNLVLATGTVNARLIGKREGQAIIQFDAVGNEPSVFLQSAAGAAQLPPVNTISVPGPTDLVLLDTPLLREQDDVPGFYAIAAGYTDVWSGAKLYKSSDGFVFSDTAQTFAVEGAIGNAATVLATFAGGNVFDETNTVDVTLLSGLLASVTEADVLEGANSAYLGGEIIQFKTATFISAGRYRLQGLLRARVGTDLDMRDHAIGETFALLTGATVRSIDVASTDIGQLRLYKAVTYGTSLSSASARAITLAANRLKPLSPVLIGGGRAANDLTINWTRRARKVTGWADSIDVPLDEPTESYEVDVFAGAGVSLLDITRSANALFTTGASPPHGLVVGDTIHLTGILGTLGALLNGRVYTVATVPSTTTFTLNVDTTSASAYTSGGSLRKRARTLTAASPTALYTAAQQTTDYGAAQATVYVAIYQLSSRVGRGFPGTGSI